ncbi:MAG: NIPSNAP family protein, partial [Hyphomicrobiales bacterium]
MIVEERIYVLHTWVDANEYLQIYENEGLSVQRPI